MISISDHALLLSVRKHSESSALIAMLTHRHGLYKGVVRGAFSDKNRGIYQVGNLLDIIWKARISEHIGSIKAELISPFAAHIMPYPQALAILSSACALLTVTLPERNSYPKLYTAFVHLLNHLANRPEQGIMEYINFELLLLAETGFGLDLGSCAATGTKENLSYISPKSGRAVSSDAGFAYKDKLLPFSPALKNSNCADEARYNFTSAEIKDALSTTSYFLDNWLFTELNRKIPPARNFLIENFCS